MSEMNKQTIFVKVDEKDKEVQRAKIAQGDLYVDPIAYNKAKQEKNYIVLYIGTDEEGNDMKSFDIIKGRKETFEFIKGMVEYLDIHESKVLTDNVCYSEAVSIYEFMKYISSIIEEDSFDIEDYNVGHNPRDNNTDEV